VSLCQINKENLKKKKKRAIPLTLEKEIL